MTIKPDEVNQNVIVVYPDTPVQEVRDRVGEDPQRYIIVETGPRQAVFRLGHLIEALIREFGEPLPDSVLDLPLVEIPGLLAAYIVADVDADAAGMTVAAARKKAIAQPLKCIVVREGGEEGPGEVLGIIGLWDDTRGGEAPAVDLKVLPDRPPQMANGGTLSGAEPAPAPAGEKPIEPRIINSELMDVEDFEKIVDPVEVPLKAGRNYVLSFYVDSVAGEGAIASAGMVGAEELFEDEDEITLTIQLESNDFDIEQKVQKLVVPRTGKSKKTRFKIVPKGDGDAMINAVFLKDGAFVQVMTLKFKVGGSPGERLFSQETAGRPINDVARLKPRDVALTILEGIGGYQIVMSGATAAFATLPLNKAQLHQMIAQARKELLEVVYFTHAGVRLYQTKIDIPTEVKDQTLVKLANAGWQLFDKLFYGPGHDLQANRMGDALKQLARNQHLKLQIFSKDFMLPWGLLYVGDNPDQPDPEQFLGLKHIIEHIPLQQGMQVLDQEIDTSSGFSISLNVNKDIDTQMGQPIIQRQIDYWKELVTESGRIHEAVRSDLFDVIEAINGETNDQFLYFYCHAISHDLSEQGGPDHSRIILTGHQELTLAKMRRAKQPLPGQPVVFINACESAELSPEFYDGFVPYFVNKGARGVIGTECETPALFAEEFAKRFFRKFLTGDQTLGEIFLELRRDYYYNHNNILGLLYGLYIDADTVVSDPVLSKNG